MKGLQLLVSLMLVARAVNKQVIASLNHLGVCLSCTQTIEWVKRVASDVRLKEGQWMLAFDNVNFQKKVIAMNNIITLSTYRVLEFH